MARHLPLVLLTPLLAACVGVASLENAVPRGSEVMEPRLLGNWELREDSIGGSLDGTMAVTREGAARYLVRWVQVHGDSAVFLGRLGPLGPQRWLLELSPVDDTTKYSHNLFGRDSTRLAPPSLPLMLPIHTYVVVERPDSGLRFALLNGDSLQAQLESGRLRAPYAVRGEELETTVLLTASDENGLRAALREFTDRPGSLMPLRRVGHRIALPAWR